MLKKNLEQIKSRKVTWNDGFGVSYCRIYGTIWLDLTGHYQELKENLLVLTNEESAMVYMVTYLRTASLGEWIWNYSIISGDEGSVWLLSELRFVKSVGLKSFERIKPRVREYDFQTNGDKLIMREEV